MFSRKLVVFLQQWYRRYSILDEGNEQIQTVIDGERQTKMLEYLENVSKQYGLNQEPVDSFIANYDLLDKNGFETGRILRVNDIIVYKAVKELFEGETRLKPINNGKASDSEAIVSLEKNLGVNLSEFLVRCCVEGDLTVNIWTAIEKESRKQAKVEEKPVSKFGSLFDKFLKPKAALVITAVTLFAAGLYTGAIAFELNLFIHLSFQFLKYSSKSISLVSPSGR